ncbi:ABC transporter ATP-binding protein [Legionella impletisoli]|uniref:ABC transporter ATP-binding protein n=1 Tax=Legionella impletisoli TaxID=343510 RepID=A0A917N992_9GAMM|nr:ABC transporter ATP-binding protein [Legionella impletisoli]GGI80052.1 ABC transporter ATP-binding protein [Legionella impletisoli]
MKLQPSIEVKQLSKVYYKNFSDVIHQKTFAKSTLTEEDKLVLDSLNFEVNSGERIGIIGRNGAGKSTLLSILAGVSKQTSGVVNIRGKVTAVMTLGLGLREDLSGRENIYLDGQIQGKTREEVDKVIDEIISFAELDDFIDKPIKTYSTGMKSRLAFSMLVGIEPEILIIDEALSAGDAFFANKASNKIKEICQRGKIVILVSHSMATIETMCNRCLWLEKGSILMDAEPTKVTKSYLKKIREEDQHQVVEESQRTVAVIDPHAKYKITHISIQGAESNYDQTVFYTKESFIISLFIEQINPGTGKLHFYIERMDGLKISHEHMELPEDNSSYSKLLKIKYSLNSLILNKGFYLIKFELIENGKITNYYSRYFEVKNDHMAQGGLSLLHYPAEIKLINEEANLCSDSKKLTTE